LLGGKLRKNIYKWLAKDINCGLQLSFLGKNVPELKISSTLWYLLQILNQLRLPRYIAKYLAKHVACSICLQLHQKERNLRISTDE
jgi:hypothetical protein